MLAAILLLLCVKVTHVRPSCQKDRIAPLDASYLSTSFAYTETINDCECDSKTCVRKCCGVDYVLRGDSCVRTREKITFEIFDEIEPVEDALDIKIIDGYIYCPHGNIYSLNAAEDPFFVQRNGSLWVPFAEEIIDLDSYCVDDIDGELSGLTCIDWTDDVVTVNNYGMIISMPFLLATFIVYGLLPERNMHGKSLMSYVISLFGAYLFLVIIQEHTEIVGAGCIALGTLCLFFFMVSFLWMNVMSIDIWWTFKGIRGLSGNKKEVEQKRFLMYSIYSWGVPLVYIIIITIINVSAPPNAWYKPGIGDGQCWFSLGETTLVYFYLPLCIIIIANVVLFARTSFRIREMQQETAILRRNENRISTQDHDKQRFYLYLKLLMAMGVNCG
ncbi:G-protein coupled receptor Mth2-like [Photinus pyralis]|uniref:G-protein coupled receptor Mth2-like n=1 Tax=Photinus pyralis TaxID=7054 RepID=UPI0012672F85|nr:G-protein coupled receptor Mth2-like [Photinus pyralis]